MKFPHLRFWRPKKAWVVGPDIPEVYSRLIGMTNVYDPYKKKAYFLFVLGMTTIFMLDIPGLFFTNPYTHIVEGWAAYLGILGAVTVGLMGLIGLWAYQFVKDSEVMLFTFGAFNLRARKNLRVPFHALLGKIEKVPDNLAEEMKAILDDKIEELRNFYKIHPIETTAQVATQTQPQTTQEQKPLSDLRREDLHLFFIPTPGIPNFPGVLLLSRADLPEQLIEPLPGEWIWEGWIRHARGEIFDLAVCGEWQYRLQGQVTIVPICAAAGTYYDFTHALERQLAPPIINANTLLLAKQNGSARIVGLEALNALQIYKDQVETNEALAPAFREQVTDMVGGILEILSLTNKFTPPQAAKKTRWGLFVGVTFLVSTLAFLGWLATHGWKL